MTGHKIKVDILNANFVIASDGKPEEMEHCIEFYSQKVQKSESIAPFSEPLKKAILAGILLASDYQELERKYRQLQQQMQGWDQKIKDILDEQA